MTPITHPGERGSMSDLQIVRLADEGVPIRALVRVFGKPFDEVSRILKDARQRGAIVELPAADWPAGTRRVSRVPTIAPVGGDIPDGFITAIRTAFRMSSCEARLLAELVWRGRASRAHLHQVVANEAEPKIIDVFVCKVRAKLRPLDIEIKTVWGWGYDLSEYDRSAIVEHLRETVVSPLPLSELFGEAAAA